MVSTLENKIREIERKVGEKDGSTSRFRWIVRTNSVDEIIGQGLTMIIGTRVGYYLFDVGQLNYPTRSLFILDDNNANPMVCRVLQGEVGNPTPFVYVVPFGKDYHSALRFVYHVKIDRINL